MKIVVTGARGLIGRTLVPRLVAGGHAVSKLTRRAPGDPDEKHWNPDAGTLDPAALEGVDAVVHLAGENLASRWTAGRKRRVLESRRRGTRLLAESIAAPGRRPRVMISASAIGFYGNRGDEILTEESSAGAGFLAEVVRAWEEATAPAATAGARVVHLRMGIVLAPGGGALARMLPLFRLGAGGPLGSGRQWVSWIAIDDLCEIVRHALLDERLAGPVNAVAPGPVRSTDFARALGRVLGRPAVLPAPAAALRLVFGEMADEALLASQRVRPARLEAAGFRFRFPGIEGALRHVLDRGVRSG